MDRAGNHTDCELDELGARRYSMAGATLHVSSGCAVMMVGGTLVALSTSDLQRVRQFLHGCAAGLYATVAQAVISPGRTRGIANSVAAIYEAQVSRLLRGAQAVKLGDEVLVCKGFKRAFGAYLGELAGPLCKTETDALWLEAHGTCGTGVLDLDGWVQDIRGLTPGTAFNLGKIYKLCPAPDTSPGLTMLERHEMICNRNTMDGEYVTRFKDELRSQILRAYIQTPGVKLKPRGAKPVWYSNYLHKEWDSVPSNEIHEALAWEGTAVMPERDPLDASCWKDSGLGFDTMEEAMSPSRLQYKSNMLTRMIFDPFLPMPGVRHSGHLHDHRVDIKPEGHKDPARAIYSGNLPDRLNQSWMEAAVHQVAVHHPSYMLGVDSRKRDERTRMIVDRTIDPFLVHFYYSFDVSGWSPKMPHEAQRISHELWAELYNEDLFRGAHRINESARVYMNKGGYQAWYINNGANFEGYNGKEMTMVLVALLALSVREWRSDIVTAGLATRADARKMSAGLLAYIDDGLAKLTLPRDRAGLLAHMFKTACERTFRKCGYDIEPSKCYPSDRFAIFLNEPYLAGRHIAHGTRAATTLSSEAMEEHNSLPQRLAALAGGARGAVMAGLDAAVGQVLLSYLCYHEITRWVSRVDPVLAAVWSVMPRAWGGHGIPSAMQLGTSGGGAALEEGVRNMQCAASQGEAMRSIFLKRARGSLEDRTPTMMLMAPLGGSIRTASMPESHVPAKLRTGLISLRNKMVLSPLARRFLLLASGDELDAFAKSVVPSEEGQVIQEVVLLEVRDVMPSTIFSTFVRRLEKSSTIFRVLGSRGVRDIIKANEADALRSYAALLTLTQI
jgi:hypothetical protein